MKNAKQFFKKAYPKKHYEQWVQDFDKWKLDMTRFAEAYHRHRVNAISDGEIENQIKSNPDLSDRYGSSVGLIKWFKNRLK